MSKKLIGIIASVALVLSLVGVTASQAAALSQTQVNAIVALLQSFGADATTVANVTASLNGQATSGSVAPATSGYVFANDLSSGSTKNVAADVIALQNFLGVSPTSANFGPKTKAAVIRYQKANGIPNTGNVGALTRAKLNGGSTGTTGTTGSSTVVPTGTDLVVSLAPSSPATGAIVAGQSIADLAEYTFTNTSATPAVVTSVSLMRGGVSNDAALSNVYLYNGVNRLTDAASISSGKITFNAPSGLFTVPAGSSMVVAVRADITSGSTYNGQIITISLLDANSNLAVGGARPVSGAAQTVSSATLAGVVVASTSPSINSISPQTDYVMWQGNVTVSNNDVYMKAISLRQVGSVSAGDISNFRLYVDGIQVGQTLSSYDANGYLTFDLSSSPVKVTASTHVLKLIGDIIGGSTKNFSFSLRQASDINLVDSQLNVNVLATATGGFPLTSGVQSVNSGSITITKTTSSPSGNVTLSGTNVRLADYTLKASGEAVKVESLKVKWTGSARGNIRNGALFASTDGVTFTQIGSTADILSPNGTTTSGTYTTYNLGSSLVVYPNSPVTLEVRGDIYASAGTQWVSGDSLYVTLLTGSSNGDLMTSLGNVNVPDSNKDGNTLTVAQGTLSLSKYSGYANQSIVAPHTAMLLGTYTLTAGTTEDLSINTITVNFLGAGASTTATSSNITDVFVTFGNKTTNNKATIVSGDNSYQVNYTLPAGQSATINVYGTLASTIGATDVVVTKLQVVGQTASSIQTVYVPSSMTYITGQAISITTGTLTPSAYAVAASSSVVAGNLVKAGSFKFVAQGDSFQINNLVGTVPYASAGNVSSVIYKIGSTVLNPAGTTIDTSDGSNAIATTSLSIQVPVNGSVIVDAYLNLASIVTPGGATSSSNVLFTLNGFEKQSSTGVITKVGGSALAGPTQYAFASVPTITPTGSYAVVQNGNGKALLNFNISADNAGPIDWNVIKFHFTKSANLGLGTNTATSTTWYLYDNGSAVVGTFVEDANLGSTTGVTSGNITFTAATPVTILAGATDQYILKTSVNGTIAGTGDSITTAIAQGSAGMIQSTTASAAASNATFVWSDDSFSNNSVTIPDWSNDILVKGIPTDSQNLGNQ